MITDKTFKDIVELSPFPVYVTSGEDMIITVANNATLKAWGRDKSVLGQRFEDVLPELHDQPFRKLIQQVYRTGETYYSENGRADLMVDGRLQTYYFKFTYQAMPDEEGRQRNVLCFATDVTDLERARQSVERSQRILYNMVSQAPIGICIISVPNLIVEVANDSYLQLVGRNRAQLEGLSIWDSVPEAAETYRPVMDSVINSGKAFIAKEHSIMLVRNGLKEQLFIDFVYEPVKDIDGSVNSVMVIAIEVTDKVQTRKFIEEAEQRARLAVEAAEIGTFEICLRTGSVSTSERFYNIFGFDREMVWDDYVGRIHPEDIGIRNQAYENASNTGSLFYEVRIIWSDKSVRWIWAQAKNYYENGNPVKMLGTLLDITDYKRLQQQKDDFISVASHELKTPMTSMKASMQVLERLVNSSPESVKIPQFVDRVNNNLAKMQQLVDSLLNVSKISTGQLGLHKSSFNVFDMIYDCCDHIRMAGDYEIITSGDPSLEVYADKYKIDQVVVNLVNNAVKYAPESKKINICVSRFHNDAVKITVTDSGPGIPASKLPFLFDRYYRVDSSGLQYSGLGLGLYISADIIKRHGGEIGVESTEGEGSTFWFTLPV